MTQHRVNAGINAGHDGYEHHDVERALAVAPSIPILVHPKSVTRLGAT